MIKCPNCSGWGLVTPDVVTSGWITDTRDGKVFVTGFFLNNEDFGVYGTTTAEITSEVFTIYTNSSPRTYFPPHEPINTTITIGGISQFDYGYFSSIPFLRPNVTVSGLENSLCSFCDGTGIVDCPDCTNTSNDTRNGDPTDGD